jgi:hypothetical protein
LKHVIQILFFQEAAEQKTTLATAILFVGTTLMCPVQHLTDALCPAADRIDPASSEPIPEATDLVIATMEPTLSSLKELSFLAKEMPYISFAAGIILKALEIRNVSVLSDFEGHLLS